MTKILLGPNGRLLLVGGKPLAVVPGAVPTTTIALIPGNLANTNARFNVQTTAASGDTTADVPVLFTYNGGAPSSVQVRAIDAGGVAIPGADWIDLQNVTVNAGVGIGYLPGVRAGANYRREIRTGALTDRDVKTFNVGPMILPWGQSNMRGTLDGADANGVGITTGHIVPGTALDEYGYFNSNNGTGTFFGLNGFVGANNGGPIGSYYTIQGGGLSMLRLIANRLKAKYGRDVGVAMNPLANNATAISAFLPGGFLNGMLTNVGTTAGSMGLSSPGNIIRGDYQAVACLQGESENPTITRAQRFSDLKAFCRMHIDHVALFGRPANKLTFLFAMMGVANPPQMEVLRGAVLDLVAYGATQGWDVRIGWNCIDLDPANNNNDTLHFGGMDQARSCRRLTQAFQNALDPVGTPFGARGPMLTGAATRSGDDVTLTVAHEGGAALAAKTPGSPITGWYANTAADFSGTDVPLTNVTIVSATQIRVTATGAPATFYIKHCGNKLYTALSYHPDVSNLIFDNFVYPTGADATEQLAGLPLLPTPDAIRVG